MGDDHDGEAAATIQISEEIDDRRLAGDIHSRGWFIKHKEIGVGGQRSGQEHALLLPCGQVAKQPLG